MASTGVKPIPEGYRSITPYLVVKGATRAIDFYKQAFGATEIMRMPGPNNTIMHAELRIGDSVIMLADEMPGAPHRSPESFGGSPVSLMVYIENVDNVFARALSLGARQMREVQDQFYGDRSGNLVDPFGHVWTVATHIEDVAPDEIRRRMEALPKSA